MTVRQLHATVPHTQHMQYHSLSLMKDSIEGEEDNSHDDTTGGEDT